MYGVCVTRPPRPKCPVIALLIVRVFRKLGRPPSFSCINAGITRHCSAAVVETYKCWPLLLFTSPRTVRVSEGANMAYGTYSIVHTCERKSKRVNE